MIKRADKVNSRLLIVGCGSLGSSLAVRLGQQTKVTVYDINAGLTRRLRRQGLVLKHGEQTLAGMIDVVCSPDQFKGKVFDGVIVATKCADVKFAVQGISSVVKIKRILFLQNGDLAMDRIVRSLCSTEVCRGVTTTAAHSDGCGTVELFFDGKFYIGPLSGPIAGARWFVQLFRNVGMNSAFVREPRRAVWAKLIFSSVMNPLPVVLGSGYGAIRQDAKIYRFVQQAVQEGRSVASALGIRLAFDPARLVRNVRRDLCALEHKGSMYHDFLSRRPLELDHMTGAILRQARRLGLKTPVLTMIYQATKQAVRKRA